MDPLAPVIASLHGEGRLRAWSLVITVFGDCVQHRGGQIGTAQLQDLLGRLAVDPGTVRTALSRLARDGWLTRSREGRQSFYRLAPSGAGAFAEAAARIYAAPAAPPARWTVLAGTAEPPPGAIALAPGCWLLPGAADAAEGIALGFEGGAPGLSEAARGRLLAPAHRTALVRLAADLAALSACPAPDPLTAAAARVALVHRWRRIVLRFPEIPAPLLPADAPLAEPRAAVAARYRALSPATEQWLDGIGPRGPSRDADARFG